MKISVTKKLAGLVIAGTTTIFTMMPVTAFAQVPETEAQVCICETKCDEDNINQECPVCSYDYTYCEGEELETAEEEPMGPLTPDGNLELVDDYGSMEAGGKQFITVTTKSGNYFYIIIDRDDNGTENVHFLNLVDESDLLALMDDDQVEEYMNKTGVGESDDTDAETVSEETVSEETDEAEEDVESGETKKSGSGVIVLVVLAIGAFAGGYLYITKFKKKKPVKASEDPDADYNEDDEDYLSSIPEDDEDDIEIPDIEDDEDDANPAEDEGDEE